MIAFALWGLTGCLPDLAPDDLASNPDHDFDGDGFVESPSGAQGGDCDDRDPATYPGAQETCTGTDSDCDGRIDEDASDALQRYLDEDADGYGTANSTVMSCQVAEGYSATGDDCDDRDPDVHPDAEEICADGLDNDCDDVHWCELDSDLTVFGGHREDDHAGYAIARAGDLDDDGITDLLIGAPENDGGSSLNTTNYGAAYVVYGPLPAGEILSLEDADHRFLGVELGRAGTSLAIVGDLDGGGLPELLIGSPGRSASGDEARAHLVLGEDIGTVYQLEDHTTWTAITQNVEGAGQAVDGGSFVDQDEMPELLIGSEPDLGAKGQAWLIWGHAALSNSSLNARGVQLTGSQEGDKAGTSVGCLGDIDGDGYDDLAIGAQRWGKDETGAVFLVSSIDIQSFAPGDVFSLDDAITVAGDIAGARWGASISPSGDLNGDGNDDFFVGAPSYDAGKGEVGAVSLILGRSGGGGDVGADTLLTGVEDGQSFGASLELGDLDEDGVLDLVTGAPARGSSAMAGSVYVHLGSLYDRGHLSADEADWRFADEIPGSDAGASVTYAPALMSDGPAIVLGLPRWSVEEEDQGAVVVVPF